MAMDKKKKKAINAQISSELFDDFDRFEHFLSNYWRQLVAAAVIIVIAVGVWVTVREVHKAADRKAKNAFANATTEEEVIKALKTYGKYKAANFARLKLARIYISQKKFDKAHEQFKMLTGSDAPKEMIWRARMDEAYTLELEGKKLEAAKAFARIGEGGLLPDTFRAEANYSAGRIYAQTGDLKNAEKYLAKSAKTAGMTPATQAGMAVDFWQGQAKFMLGMVKGGELEALKNQSASQAPAAAEPTGK
ncbi:tetratricopeptide repeat protein [Lentisphaerota bacterium ZTH]|nr:tetratricopeptide repeat protein [Lentisphaerota bacterium]WET05639.1 tetratricopeptide repeat protein [Lentisphaerota bacterium ZTH]